jgi:hypothetical protein
MLLGTIFERFANGSPLTVMLRGTLEYALRPELLDQLFIETARRQYIHKLLFSTLVDYEAVGGVKSKFYIFASESPCGTEKMASRGSRGRQ